MSARPLSPDNAGPAFSHAFQPIVDVTTRSVFSYEALIRGTSNESAFELLRQVPEAGRRAFETASRTEAIRRAAQLGLDCCLNLNFSPKCLAAYSTSSIGETLQAATAHGIAVERIILEVTEDEAITDYALFTLLLNEYRAIGLKVAIDDFGAGHSGLNLLAEFQPEQVKIDMNLVRGIERDGPRQAIARAIVQVCLDLGIDVIAEGVETVSEYRWFAAQGVRLFQGYLFARPGFENFPPVTFP